MGDTLASGFYNMDCMEGMKRFPDKFFDLAIVDPPYGINVTGTPGGAIRQRSEPISMMGGVQTGTKDRQRSEERNPSERQTKIGGVSLCRPKSITPSTTKSHRMQSISLS